MIQKYYTMDECRKLLGFTRAGVEYHVKTGSLRQVIKPPILFDGYSLEGLKLRLQAKNGDPEPEDFGDDTAEA